MRSDNRGFTLIELIVVIVILGILSATALPKFINLSTDARIVAVKSLQGALQSTVAMAHAKCLIDSACSTNTDTDLPFEGKTIKMWYRYPNAGDNVGVNMVDILIDTDGFTISTPSQPYNTKFSFTTAPDPGNCSVNYREADSLTIPPVISMTTSGC